MAQVAASAKPKTSILQIEITKQKVKRDELMHLSPQLGAFVRAGLPPIEAVRILGQEAKNRTVRTALDEHQLSHVGARVGTARCG